MCLSSIKTLYYLLFYCGKIQYITVSFSILYSFVHTNLGFLNVVVASQSEITRKLEKSISYDNDESKSEGRGLLSRSQITHGEHPLSLGKTSIWNQFFQVTSSDAYHTKS